MLNSLPSRHVISPYKPFRYHFIVMQIPYKYMFKKKYKIIFPNGAFIKIILIDTP